MGKASKTGFTNFTAIHPKTTWAVVLVIIAMTISGLFKLEYDDNYHNLFRSNHAFFKEYENFRNEFTFDDNDFIIIATANDILSTDNLSSLYALDQSLRDKQFVDSVFSLFSVLSFDDHNYGESIYPGSDAGERDLDQFRDSISHHVLSEKILLSSKLDAALLVVSLGNDQWSVAEIEPFYQQITELANTYSNADLNIAISGIPALRTAVVRSTQRDQIVFQGMGLILCVLLGIVMFHNFAAVIVTNLSAALGPLILLGAMGHLGVDIDPVNVVAPTLLLILCFADSVHMVSHIRDRLAAGDQVSEATANAVKEVGPACILTALTTIVAFLSLPLFSNTAAIQRFGIIGAGGMLSVLASVVIFVPLLSNSVMKPLIKSSDGSWNKLDRYAQPVIATLSKFAIRYAKLISVISIGGLLLCGKLAFDLSVDYRYVDHIPQQNPAYDALITTEKKMGGGLPLRIFVDIPGKDEGLISQATLDVLQRIHDIFRDNPNTHGPFSILNLLNSMPDSFTLMERTEELDLLSESVLNRLINEDRSRVVVSAWVADQGSAIFEPILDRLEEAFFDIEKQYNGYEISVSGLFATSSRVGHRVIPELAGSLAFAALVICLLVATGLRSIKLGLISILPNAFPIIMICSTMYFASIPLQYITVLAFTVCLGVGVDDTIHYLYRYRFLRKNDRTTEASLILTSQQIGRALMLTTIVVASGMSVLLFSASRVTRQFGVISASAVVLALLADLVMLVALLKYFDDSAKLPGITKYPNAYEK